ncbi:hypothetical protein BSKO_02306 [Bryopsis sp. KO-2023]|nr:hypothetical protein BSKO_02306 [Bryopsis sp. KO-2023]
MKKNTHTIVPKDKFRILAGKESLTDYQFGSKTAHHYFCRVCGIHSFYIPRSNPDGFAVTIYCINPGTVRTVTVNEFDGENWEHSFSGSTISKLSKD